MIVDVFIIRKGMRDFLLVDPETDNWDWTQNLDDATIYKTQEKAEMDKLQKKLDDAWVYRIPYSVTQQRKKKSTKKKPVKRSIKKKRK